MSEQKLHQIDGVTYREVDRKAEVGDYVLVTKMDGYDVNVVAHVINNDFDGDNSFETIQINREIHEEDLLLRSSFDDEYYVIEPVIDTSGALYSVEAADEPTEPDMVESPPHYNAGRFEVIDVIEDALDNETDPVAAYCIGNVIKYLMRRNHKHGSPVDCMRKAEWYLRRAIEHIEAEENGVK